MGGQPACLAVVMGVSGCGKSTVGALLAEALGAAYLEGDDLHPPGNVARMAAGTPLTDDDRRDWLLAIAQRIATARAERRGLVVSCSALKRHYRDTLRSAAPELAFVHLSAEAAVLAERVRTRAHAYMPASLLASQLQTLEAPGLDERAATFEATLPPAAIAAQAAAWLRAPTHAPGHAAPSSSSSETTR